MFNEIWASTVQNCTFIRTQFTLYFHIHNQSSICDERVRATYTHKPPSLLFIHCNLYISAQRQINVIYCEMHILNNQKKKQTHTRR